MFGTGVGPRTILMIVALAASSLVAGSPQQTTAPRTPARPQAPLTFKAGVEYVETPVVVVNARGQFVPTLGQDDFEILEDGRRQTITSFRLVDLPVSREDRPLFLDQEVPPDIQTNITPFEGRLYILLLDDLHVEAVNTIPTRAAATAFVERHVGSNDLAAVVCTSGRLDASQDFTSSRSLLLAAIARFSGRGLRSAALNRVEDAQSRQHQVGRAVTGNVIRDNEARERAYNASVVLSTIRRLSQSLGAIQGRRKAVLLFSQGLDVGLGNIRAKAIETEGREMNIENLFPGASGDLQMVGTDTVAAATRANVSIFGIDPRGLTVSGGADSTMMVSPEIGGGTDLQSIQMEMQVQRESLERLSDQTGGFAAVNQNNLLPAFDRIRDDNSRYYLIGYYAPPDRRDGKFHAIDVRVRTPGLTVRARRGYVAARASAKPATRPPQDDQSGAQVSEALRGVIDNPLPVPGLRLTMSAATFRGQEKNAAVRIVLQVGGPEIGFNKVGERFEGTLVLSLVATDPGGKVQNGFSRRIAMPLRADAHEQVKTHGIRIVERLDLPPGRYRLRVGVEDVVSGLVGSVHCDADVPDFESTPLALSGLVLTSNTAGRVPSAPGGSIDALRKVLPGPPTVSRVFAPGEILGLLAEIYDRDAAPHSLDITTAIRDASGQVVFRHDEARTSADLETNGGSYAYTSQVPLAGLPPGLYLLELEARSRLGRTPPAVRRIQFEVAGR